MTNGATESPAQARLDGPSIEMPVTLGYRIWASLSHPRRTVAGSHRSEILAPLQLWSPAVPTLYTVQPYVVRATSSRIP